MITVQIHCDNVEWPSKRRTLATEAEALQYVADYVSGYSDHVYTLTNDQGVVIACDQCGTLRHMRDSAAKLQILPAAIMSVRAVDD